MTALAPPDDPSDHAACIRCTAERACLPLLLALIDRACERHGIDSQTGHDLRLIVEEGCVNIMAHAYPGGRPGALTLRVNTVSHGGRPAIVISFEDQGIPFDPLALPRPNRAAALDELQIGGLGVHLMRELSDAQHYLRDPERGNVLTITKFLVPPRHA
ncbi:MAG: ATP-binding protein [Variovorax sp.]